MNRCTIRSLALINKISALTKSFSAQIKQKIISNLLIASVLLFLPCAVSALPGPHDPATGGRGYTCLNCHTGGATLGAASWNNICTTCHNGGIDPAGGAAIKQFKENDYANPYGTESRTGTVYQTSHKWTGSDTIPQAGALPPVDGTAKGMNKRGLTGSVTCARCHNVHGDSVPTSAVSPYLRSTNDADQMCMNCHRVRDQKTHLFGSHPVNVSYTSAKVKSQPTAYFASPLTNTANPSAQVKLVNGKLVCTTCHGVHFTDSNSRTFDNHSAAVLGVLSTSKGTLLRVDARGGNVDNTNICTNCHNKLNHSTTMNIQCVDCHSGHVDYITPQDVANGEGTPNTYLLRRYANYSAGVKISGYRRKMFYTYTTLASAKWRLANGKGVCEGCHTPPATVPEHASATNRSTCTATSCHGPGHIGKDPIPGCGTTVCHGVPPQNTSAGYPTGYGYDVVSGQNYTASGVFKNESTAGHPTHAAGKAYSYKCDECHKGNKVIAGNHNAGGNNAAAFQYVFVDKTTILASTAGGATPAANPAYTGTGSGTCANMYCHSNGVTRAGGTAKYKSVTWAASRKTLVGTANECIACHNGVKTASFNTMSTNSHFRHVSNLIASGKGYTCNYCHPATVSSNTAVSNTANHVNGVAEVSLTGTYGSLPVNGTWSAGPATCATSYCHSDGKGVNYATATWTNRSSGYCGTCHATSPAIGGSLINTNAHFAHFSSTANSYGPMLTQANTNGCAACHTYTGELQGTHVDGAINLAAGGCTTCHKNATTTYTWSAGRVTCASCHDGTLSVIKSTTAPRIDQALFTSNGHGQFNSFVCADCHNSSGRHINGVLGDKRLLSGLGSGSDNTECTYCHNNSGIVTNTARQNMKPHVTAKGSGPTGLCNECHTPHGTTNLSMVKLTIRGKAIVFANRSTGFISKVAVNGYYLGLCQVCHTNTNVFQNTTGTSGGTVPRPTAALGGHYNDRNCWSCHDHKGVYAFEPAGGGSCNGCHGYPPAAPGFTPSVGNYVDATKGEDFTGGGGAHTVAGHIKPTALQSEGWLNCTNCHTSGSHAQGGVPPKRPFINITSPDTYRFNPAKPTSYSGDHSSTVGTCSNVSCHFKASPIWNRP